VKHHTEFQLDQTAANKIEEAYNLTEGEDFTVADLGCGKALYHEDMKKKLSGLIEGEINIVGFDLNREPLEYTDDNNTAQADLVENDIPIQENSADFVYSSHLRCQISKSELEEIKNDADRVLKEGGTQLHRC
jgi:ubiquinone/menaquinone biosynthesis C-methylase UbiE